MPSAKKLRPYPEGYGMLQPASRLLRKALVRNASSAGASPQAPQPTCTRDYREWPLWGRQLSLMQ